MNPNHERGLYSSPVESAVALRLFGDERELRILVHNGGPAIAAPLMAQLFAPMQRGPLSEGNASRSIGLGLFIVKHIVDAHGGTISADSGEPRGTTFTAVLPRSAR